MTRRTAAAAGVADDVKAALPGWVAARVLTVVAWFASRWWIDHREHGGRPFANTLGLFAWDGSFYRGLAEHGYQNEATEALRFFPLYPLLGRAVHSVFAITEGTALLILANVAALGAGALVHRITKFETGDGQTARRAAWAIAIVPPAFVLTWAYAEAVFIVLAGATFLALRRERWVWAGVFGFAAALTRPTGVFLALAAVIEGGRGIRQKRVAELGPRAVAVAGPVAGLLAFLWWVGDVFGDWKLPLHVQDSLRGGNENPIIRVGEAASDLLHREVDGLHFPFAVLFVVLLVVVWQRLPLSYGVYSTAIVVTSLAARNLNSIERYGLLNAFPLVIGLALLANTKRSERVVAAVSAIGFVWMAVLAWIATYVP